MKECFWNCSVSFQKKFLSSRTKHAMKNLNLKVGESGELLKEDTAKTMWTYRRITSELLSSTEEKFRHLVFHLNFKK